MMIELLDNIVSLPLSFSFNQENESLKTPSQCYSNEVMSSNNVSPDCGAVDAARFLAPTPFIDSNHPAILAVVDRLGVSEISPRERAVILFAFVRDKIPYRSSVPMLKEEDYIASATLDRGFGMCIQKAALLAALCRASGIPAQVCFADIRNHRASSEVVKLLGTNEFIYHGYDVLWLEDKWVKATPTFDQALCDRTDTFAVEFDGIHDAILPSFDKQGRAHVEYLRQIGCYPDIPAKEFLAAFWTRYIQDNPRIRSLVEGNGMA